MNTNTCLLLEVHCIRNVRRISGPIAAIRRLLEARGLCVVVLCLSDWEDEKIDNELLLRKVILLRSSGSPRASQMPIISGK